MAATCKTLDIDRRYSVDTEGNVYGVKGQKLKPWKACKGKYLQVGIAGRKLYVHRLVAELFIPNPDGKTDVAHGDGDGLNNAVSNLRWATVAENMSDRLVHGTNNHGERHGLAKLTDNQVTFMRSCRGLYRGVQRDLALIFNVSQVAVSQIMNGQRWKRT